MEWFSALPGIDELNTAEAFFEYFELEWDPTVVRAKRLHIMHEFHRRLVQVIDVPSSADNVDGQDPRDSACWSMAQHLLSESYRHFLQGNLAATSGLSIYQRHQPCFVPWSQLTEVLP
ncbi:nitrogenase-stabilizing/protective protein NifW [Acerihabitans sp. TG2]|uniref:nitrogenase-stabilizing/protective protein NifW n=1 Tax=Acerihabitans sp. TG2 TaxID=3096008 RepID=UPI002B23D1A2|nr:nitrogenase-stabilizing/protective protein NifW [Acerihabitans sp. TG2]MEA9393247.1 nitrogenase-stabilizing/protective protein NifW [Acerihabitans sp. TG2]